MGAHGLMERSEGGFQLEFFQIQEVGEEMHMSVVASVLLNAEQLENIRDSLTDALEYARKTGHNKGMQPATPTVSSPE